MAFQDISLALCLDGVGLLMFCNGGTFVKQTVLSSILTFFLTFIHLSHSRSGFGRVEDTASVQGIHGSGEETSSLSKEIPGRTPSPSPWQSKHYLQLLVLLTQSIQWQLFLLPSSWCLPDLKLHTGTAGAEGTHTH